MFENGFEADVHCSPYGTTLNVMNENGFETDRVVRGEPRTTWTSVPTIHPE